LPTRSVARDEKEFLEAVLIRVWILPEFAALF